MRATEALKDLAVSADISVVALAAADERRRGRHDVFGSIIFAARTHWLTSATSPWSSTRRSTPPPIDTFATTR